MSLLLSRISELITFQKIIKNVMTVAIRCRNLVRKLVEAIFLRIILRGDRAGTPPRKGDYRNSPTNLTVNSLYGGLIRPPQYTVE